MNILLSNLETEVADDVGNSKTLATIISGDIYIDANPFGYFHAIWCRSTTNEINIVIHAQTDPAHSIAILLEGQANLDKLKVCSEPTTFYDTEWCETNDVVFSDTYKQYSKAVTAASIGTRIFNRLEDLLSCDGELAI